MYSIFTIYIDVILKKGENAHTMETQQCRECATAYSIDDAEKSFFAGLLLQLPTLCPSCRQRRRLAFRNTRKLYKRPCGLCNEGTLSIYSPDKQVNAYCTPCYWSEMWDPMGQGSDFDFSRPFFPQFAEWMKAVPTPALIQVQPSTIENSQFTNEVWRITNSYLIFDGEKADASLYGETFFDVRECMDFSRLINCERCYECIGCTQCYNVKYSQWSQNCSDSWFLLDCNGCTNCFGCVNLVNQEYCLFNESVGKERYLAFLASLDLSSTQKAEEMKRRVAQLFLNHPRRAVRGIKSEQVIGDNLFQSNASVDCFDCTKIQNCRYCTELPMGGKDCQDIDIWGGGIEQCYNCTGVGENAQKIIASFYVFDGVYNIEHSILCYRGCHDLFACIGLSKKEYCIMNKQYSEREYRALREKIIAHMTETGEYAQFFPVECSPFGYNESKAQDFMPLLREKVEDRGWGWFDAVNPAAPPDAVICQTCSRPFRTVKREIAFYEREKLPTPIDCFECRHQKRNAFKNPRALFARTCARCQKECLSSYDFDCPEIIYCEHCYSNVIH